MGEVRVGIDVEARDRASAEIGKARLAVQQYTAEINRLKREGSSGADVSKQLGEAMLRQAEAAKRVRDAMARATEAQSPFRAAVQGATDAMAAQSGAASGLLRSLSGLGGPIGVAAVAFGGLTAALVGGAHRIAQYQEQLDLAAEATGFTTGELAGLRVAASESGRSFDQIRPSLDFFVKKIGEAAEGNKQALKTFTDLGIGVKDATGAIRPSGDVLRDVQDQLSGIASPAERAKTAVELFGARGAASLNILLTPLDAAEEKARKLGLALGADAEQVARQANQAFDQLSTSVQGLANSFGVAAATIVGPFLQSLAQASTAAARFVKDPNWRDLKEVMLRWAGKPELVPLLGPSQADIDSAVFNPPNRPWGPRTEGVMSTPAPFSPGFVYSGMGPLEYRSSDQPVYGAGSEADRWQQGLRDAQKLYQELTMRQAENTAEVEKLTAAEAKAKQEIQVMGQMVADGFGGAVESVIRGTSSIAEAFENLVRDMLAQIIGAAARKGIMSLLGLPFQAGGTVGLQAGGTVSASFAHPLQAQSGLVVSGVRGMDTVPALLGRGETVIDHSLTDQLRLFLADMKRTMVSAPAPAMAAAGPINLTLNYNGGSFNAKDRMQLQQFTRDELVPALRRATNRGGRV